MVEQFFYISLLKTNTHFLNILTVNFQQLKNSFK